MSHDSVLKHQDSNSETTWEEAKRYLTQRRISYTHNTKSYLQVFFDQWFVYLDLWHKPRTTWHIPSQWEIYTTRLDPTIWWELQKTRPCIIYSIQSANRWDCVICIPIKTLKQIPKHNFRVKFLPTKENGLDTLSYASLCDLRSLSKSRLWTKRWSLSPGDLARLHQYISILFGIQKTNTEKRDITSPFS